MIRAATISDDDNDNQITLYRVFHFLKINIQVQAYVRRKCRTADEKENLIINLASKTVCKHAG